ncbi:MAG: hypothetical protein L0Y35_09910 [Flammeovirgaceae bacterium]|nr:hypothetical protein [Flammeovirgaceae bacterium]
MYVPFESLPGHARIWIYQSVQKITKESQVIISDRLHAFTDQWKAHGNSLTASYVIKHDHFVLIAVDENVNDASGCSIDSSTQVMKEIQIATGLELFDRTTVFFKKDDEILALSLKDLPSTHQKGLWDETSLVFDNMVGKKQDLDQWIKPASQTWLKRYLTKITA